MLVNYKAQGQGEPILFMHGLFGSLSNLGQLARAFASQYQCYQLDLLNHGRSAHTDNMSYFCQADAIKAFILDKGLEPVTLIGHSMGGKVAMALALSYPQLVKKLVILDIAPVVYQTNHHENVIKGLKEVSENSIASTEHAEIILAKHIKESHVRQFLLSSLYKTNNKMNWRFNLAAIIACYGQIMDWPYKDEVKCFDGDTLFIKGQNSDYILPKHKDTINKQFPNAKASIIAGAGHWLHSQKSNSVIRFVQQFLSK